MAEKDGSGVDPNVYLRRSTVMTGLVNLSLLSTTFLLLKKIVEAGTEASHYSLLVSMTSLLLIVLIVMLVLVCVVFVPKISLPVAQVEKIAYLQKKMDEFRSRYKAEPGHEIMHRTLLDEEVLDMFMDTEKKADKENTTYNAEYYTKVIKHYRENFPKDSKKTDGDIWFELKNLFKQYKNVNANVTEFIKTRKHTDNMNAAIAGLSAIVLVLMILIDVFRGRSTFSNFID